MFDQLAPFLQDYIYNKGWQELKEIQLKSFNVLTNTNNNLLFTNTTPNPYLKIISCKDKHNLFNTLI